MSAISALSFLIAASARNRLRAAARRMRSPRHAVAMVLGGAWLGFMVLQQLVVLRQIERAGSPGPIGGWPAGRVAWFVELGLLTLLLLGVALTWALGRDGALGFTEAEIQLLFPAPLKRRQLVNYKVAQGALASLVMAVVLVIVFGRGGPVTRAIRILGGWTALTTIGLHGMGASLTRATLVQHGVSGLRKRIITLAVAALLVTAAGVGAWRAPGLDSFADGAAGLEAWTRALVGTAPLSWALYPLRVSLEVAFSPGTLLLALPGALAVLAVHYLWVMSSDAAFEEAAVDAARRATRAMEVVQRGLRVGRHKLGWLRLDSAGRPEFAFLWKAMVRATRFVSVRALSFTVSMALVAIVFLVMARLSGDRWLLGVGGLVCYAMVLVAGPLFVNPGLDKDVTYLEVLRALPVRGSQVVVGELATPALALTAAQWILLVPVVLGGSIPVMPGHLAGRLAVGATLGIVGPLLTTAALLARTLLVVIYPGWFSVQGAAPASLSRSGVGVVSFMLGTLAELGAALVIALAGGAVLYLLWPTLGYWAAPLAGLVAAVVCIMALALAATLVGRVFESIEPES